MHTRNSAPKIRKNLCKKSTNGTISPLRSFSIRGNKKPIKTDYLSTNFSVTIQSIDFSKINRSKLDEYIEHEKKFMLFDYEYNKEMNEYLYECQYKTKLPIENIIISFLTYLSKTWSNKDNKKNVIGVVLSIPDYFTLYQRKIMLNILKISNINCYSLLNESSSVCLSYFLHHYKGLSPSKEKII